MMQIRFCVAAPQLLQNFKPKQLYKTLCIAGLVGVTVSSPYVMADTELDTEQKRRVLSDPVFAQLIKKLNTGFQQPVKSTDQAASDASAELGATPVVGDENTETGFSEADNVVAEGIATSEEATGSRFAVGEDLILQLKLEDIKLNEIFAIKSNEIAHVGFIALIQQLDFPIEVDLNQNIAKGWFIREENTFDLRWSEDGATVTINGNTQQLAKEHYTVLDDDIYIEATKLAEWFRIDIQLNDGDLLLELKPKTKLPIQERLERKDRQVQTNQYNPNPVLPFRETGYQLFSAPILDAQVGVNANKSSNVKSYSVLGTHELAYLTSEFFVIGDDQDAVRDMRLTLTKEKADKSLLGPLRASEIKVGDIVPTNIGVSQTGSMSRGISVSNSTIQQLTDNKTVNLTGAVQIGWDVELYRNGVLIDRLIAVSNGRYEFNDVELQFGQNDFEMVFYGPQGQIETKTESYSITSNALEQGQGSYKFSVSQVGKGFLGVSDQGEEKGILSNAIYRLGLTDGWSAGVGVSNLDSSIGRDTKQVSTTTSLALFGKMLLDATYDKDQDDTTNTQYGLRSTVFDQAISARYREQSATKQNQDTGNGLVIDQPENSLDLAMSGRLFGNIFPVGYHNTWRQMETSQGIKLNQFSNSLSFYTPWFGVSNQLDWSNTKIPLLEQNNQLTSPVLGGQAEIDQDIFDQDFTGAYSENVITRGAARLTRSFGSVYTQLGVVYDVKPTSEISGYSASVFWPVSDKMQAQFSTFYSPLSKQTRTEAGLNYRHDIFNFSFNGTYNTDGNWSAGLFARMSFGYEPATGQSFVSGTSLASGGNMAVRVFEDKNQNNKYDKGEPLIEKAKVKAVQGYRQSETNAQGVAVLQNMQHLLTTDIVLDRASLDDPFMTGAIEGVSVTPRRGIIDVLEFPVVSTGEVEGSIFIKGTENASEPAAFVTIHLLDSKGTIIETSQTEFDGYYVFAEVKPGNYKIKIDKASLKNKKLRQATPLYTRVTGGGNIVNGADFTLEQLEASKGYAVHIGDFSNLNVLKAYWLLVGKSGMNMAKLRPFYINNLKESRYSLYGAFYADHDKATKVCMRLSARNVKCTVREHEFEL